ncbi:o-succinylbenzoate synthase [Gulosibacter molinativorax]|uniref:o-succinylbenzoate synthase n=1 Tax=Gulosibacter molinativorax TaxID=256821 RepID=A0ABT7CC30_9MICO|nr:o-succinylbenzoate synthase [Gulosibacter molinativorax]MDJ1372312.1 O-succinylbenzoate synthase [Gulosibacter molinativorax]
MLPSLPDLLDRTRIVSLPLNTKFRGVTQREAAIIEGTWAWSEFSPFLEYDAEESANWLTAAIEYGFDPTLERLCAGWVDVNATVPAVRPEEVPGVLARFDGCRTVKVKVAERGQTLADDLARIEAVAATLPEASLRIDANAGWQLDEAEHALREIAKLGITLEYAEQPVATVPELAELRQRIRDLGTRIAADESVRKATDPLAVARAGAADHVIVKVQPLGGIRNAARVVKDAGLTATVSSALDTSVGIVMGAQLAARLPEPRFAAGLGTVSLFAADVLAEPRRPKNGRVSLEVALPRESLLREYRASAEREKWWHERIRACHEVLVARAEA